MDVLRNCHAPTHVQSSHPAAALAAFQGGGQYAPVCLLTLIPPPLRLSSGPMRHRLNGLERIRLFA